MKTFAVSLLIVLLSLNSFAQEAEAESPDLNAQIEQAQELARPTPAPVSARVDRQRSFNLRGIELFEQAINDSATYRMVILVDNQVTHEERKPIKPDGSSGSIARGFADQMRRAVNGAESTEDGIPLKFECQQQNILSNITLLRNLRIVNPGRCRLTLKTTTDGQKQKVVLSFVMELANTPEHQNWPSKIISPEIELKISSDNNQ